jgi:hypothetical protein
MRKKCIKQERRFNFAASREQTFAWCRVAERFVNAALECGPDCPSYRAGDKEEKKT